MSNLYIRRRALALALFVLALAGCAPETQRLANTISHPGPAAYQRAQAIQHDPYLLDDVGPEVVGARPREYQRPLNEVERARLAAPPPPGVAVIPPPGAALAPPPVMGPAYATAPPPGGTVTTPYPATPAQTAPPVYPVASQPQATPFQYQPRAPY